MKHDTYGVFEKIIQKYVFSRLLIVVLIGSILFAAGIYATVYSVNEKNSDRYLDILDKVYTGVYTTSSKYLLDENVRDMCMKILTGEAMPQQLKYSFYEFNANSHVGSHLILSNSKREIIYSSLETDNLNEHLMTFNQIVCENASKDPNQAIYNAVYYFTSDYSDYVFCHTIYSNKKVIGYLNLYLSGSDWNNYFSNYNLDGVITDASDNVIFCSRKRLITPINKFHNQPGRNIIYDNGERYRITSRNLAPYVHIYSLVYYPDSNTYLIIGLAVIILIGVSWGKIASSMARTMAEKNASSINELVRQIKIIRKGEHEHRISMDTGDEFSDVAIQINRMLDNIKELNEKNTELLQLNSTIEINQLTAQINPHFLYNTLEIIRYLVLQDGKKAESLIVQLTQILRYSINSSKKDVRLEEDMKYIKDYLDIQSCRFGDRFQYAINIDAACNSCIIPKLLLQPIIENSIKYGFKKKMEIMVSITGSLENNVLCLKVTDNGMGMTEEEIEKLQQSMEQSFTITEHNGLHNIARRLYLQYGSKSGIRFQNIDNEGLEVSVFVAQEDKEGK